MKVSHQLLDTCELYNLAPIPCFHRHDGLGVGNAKLEGKGLVSRRSRQKDAHRLGETQPHGVKRLGGLRLELLIDPDMNHRTCALHIDTLANIVYGLRYKNHYMSGCPWRVAHVSILSRKPA